MNAPKQINRDDPGSIDGASFPDRDESDITIIAKTRFLELVKKDGWEYVRRCNCNGVVAIIAVTENRELVLTEQFRPAVGKRVIDLPAGLIADSADESVVEAVAHELEEEVGFRAKELKVLFKRPTSPGMSNEIVTFVRASKLEQVSDGGGLAEEGEYIQVHKIPTLEIEDWLLEIEKSGVLIDPKIDIALKIFYREQIEQS